MDLSQTSPDTALKLKPSFELDVFIYRYIFDGVLEVVSSAAGQQLERPIPSFSRRAEAAKALLVKMFMENDSRRATITFGDVENAQGKAAGQIPEDAGWPVWRVDMSGHAGFGRSLEEAICKLAIVMRMQEGQ